MPIFSISQIEFCRKLLNFNAKIGLKIRPDFGDKIRQNFATVAKLKVRGKATGAHI